MTPSEIRSKLKEITACPGHKGGEREMRTFKEVALDYFPTNTPRSATTALRREIARHACLPQLLRHTGWHPRRRYLTPLQCLIIAYYIG